MVQWPGPGQALRLQAILSEKEAQLQKLKEGHRSFRVLQVSEASFDVSRHSRDKLKLVRISRRHLIGNVRSISTQLNWQTRNSCNVQAYQPRVPLLDSEQNLR